MRNKQYDYLALLEKALATLADDRQYSLHEIAEALGVSSTTAKMLVDMHPETRRFFSVASSGRGRAYQQKPTLYALARDGTAPPREAVRDEPFKVVWGDEE